MALKDIGLGPQTPKNSLDAVLDSMDEDAMFKLRAAIDKRLSIDPRLLNLADELGYQYKAGKNLLDSIQDDHDVPANQRAQVFNSVTAMLDKIVKQMKDVYNAERLKRYEAAVMKSLEDMPDEVKKKFFDLYGDYLKQEATQ